MLVTRCLGFSFPLLEQEDVSFGCGFYLGEQKGWEGVLGGVTCSLILVPRCGSQELPSVLCAAGAVRLVLSQVMSWAQQSLWEEPCWKWSSISPSPALTSGREQECLFPPGTASCLFNISQLISWVSCQQQAFVWHIVFFRISLISSVFEYLYGALEINK